MDIRSLPIRVVRRALETESTAQLAQQWGVTRVTIWRWRRLLVSEPSRMPQRAHLHPLPDNILTVFQAHDPQGRTVTQVGRLLGKTRQTIYNALRWTTCLQGCRHEQGLWFAP